MTMNLLSTCAQFVGAQRHFYCRKRVSCRQGRVSIAPQSEAQRS